MALFDSQLKEMLPDFSVELEERDPLVKIKFFDTVTGWSWYPLAFDGKDMFFGLVLGLDRELGFFSLAELESLNDGAAFCRIKRDEQFAPTRISNLVL